MEAFLYVKIQKPFIFQKIMDAGSSHPFIARISNGIPDLLNGTILSKQQRESLTSLCFHISKDLISAEEKSLPIIRNIEEIEKRLEQIEKIDPNSTLPEIPSVMNLKNAENFFHFGKKALRHFCAALGIILGKEFKEAKLYRIKSFIETLPNVKQLAPLLDALNHYNPYISKFIDRRNKGTEHPDPLKSDYTIESKNGCYTLKRPSFKDGILILDCLKDSLELIFDCIEEIFLIIICIYLKPYITIYEIPEEKRDRLNPKRFRLALR